MSLTLIFSETHNRRFKHDGDEFKARARDMDEMIESANPDAVSRLILAGKSTKKQKQTLVSNTLAQVSNLKRLAFFCHGWPSGISLGYSIKEVPLLARSIAAACENHTVYIGLFACLTGRGRFWGGKRNKKNFENRSERVVTPREGFAMYLCAQLEELGIHAIITAHLTSGHTTRNPYKVRIEKEGSHYNKTRMCLPQPRAQWHQWLKKLTNDPGFPFRLLRLGRQMWHR